MEFDHQIRDTKREIERLQFRLQDLYYQRQLTYYQDLKPLEQLIKKYPGGSPYPDPPRHYGYQWITVLRRYKMDKKLLKKTDYLFPYTEAGYFGRSGDCALLGKIEFTEEEQKLLKRYGVLFRHVSGQMRGA